MQDMHSVRNDVLTSVQIELERMFTILTNSFSRPGRSKHYLEQLAEIERSIKTCVHRELECATEPPD